MSQIIYNHRIGLLIVLLIAGLTACGTPNDQADFDVDAQRHAADWLPAGHVTACQADISSCKECHGSDLAGGISKVSCTICHMGDAYSAHPLDWQGNATLNHRWYAFKIGTDACSNIYCHGANLGGVAQSGPACASCHSPVPSVTNCSGCHRFPPAGTIFPNIAGSHAKHTDLRGADCSICHLNNTHINWIADVNFQSRYSANAGAASYNAAALTCSNVRCHGGQTTPNWRTGTIDVSTQCTACHAFGVSEYNGYSSGKHFFHVNYLAITCAGCHDAGRLANGHFVSLYSGTLEGRAAETLNDGVNFNGTTCTNATCHAGVKIW